MGLAVAGCNSDSSSSPVVTGSSDDSTSGSSAAVINLPKTGQTSCYDGAGAVIGFVGGMEFDVSKAPANRVADPQELFSATDRRIYASFETLDYGEREVMVKWSRVDSSEVLIYDKYPIMTGADHNYVWLEQPQGWDAGDYQVEIYSLEDNLSLLARGSYGVD